MTKTTTITNSFTPEAIPDRLYFRIGDVATMLGVKPYVLRYWETEFPMISPEKKNTGQRVYRRSDVETLMMIKHLLYVERYSIEGARRRIRELRKDGVLKEFVKEAAAAPAMAAVSSELRQAVLELKALIDTPIESLFA